MGMISNRRVDVAVIIDRMGDFQTVRERRQFADAVMGHLEGELGRDNIRGAVLAYAVPPPDRPGSGYTHSPVDVLDFCKSTSARLNLVGATVSEVDSKDLGFEAALGEALQLLRGLHWHPQALHVALTVGSRPPLPPYANPLWKQGANPSGDWLETLERLIAELKLHSIAVLCPIYWPAVGPRPQDYARYYWPYASDCWARLGRSGLFEAETLAPKHIARLIAVGLLT